MHRTPPNHYCRFVLAWSLLALSLVTVGCTTETAKVDPGAETVEEVIPEFALLESAPPIEVELDGMPWVTSEPGPMGDTRATKGGIIVTHMPNWPENLRRFGTGSNTFLNYLIRDLCYESLLGSHPQTLEFTPGLATHWHISDDQTTFRFKIDPNARWSDGKPVVANDWIATWNLILDDTLIEPMSKVMLEKMDPPVETSPGILEIKCRERDWRNFLTVSGLTPLPAHEIEGMTGEEYLEKYNFKFNATTGPYIVNPSDIKDEESITLTRRDDWWAIGRESATGLYNFDKIKFVVVRDQRKAFEKALKGEIDFYDVNTAKWWVEDVTSRDEAQKGWLIRREIYTRFPKGYQGMCYNMRKPPLDDVRVRTALARMYDRRTMLKKFAYDQYVPNKSYYPGSDGENPDNKMVEFDIGKAVELLSEAGWKERGPDGIFVKDGKRLSFSLMYRTAGFEKYLTAYKEACRKGGVEINLKQVTPETAWKSAMERSFEIYSMSWGAILYPNPRTSWHSEMANKDGSNNLGGFKNEEVDSLIDEYDAEFDLSKRNEILRKIDGIVFNQHPYALDWYKPCERILYWNKFGMPDYGLNKYDEWDDAFALWWYDKDKADKLKEARRNGSALPIPPMRIRPWGKGGGVELASDAPEAAVAE